MCARVLWFTEPPLDQHVITHDPSTGLEVFYRQIVDIPNMPSLVPLSSIVRVEHFVHACNLEIGEHRVVIGRCEAPDDGTKKISYNHALDLNPYHLHATRF